MIYRILLFISFGVFPCFAYAQSDSLAQADTIQVPHNQPDSNEVRLNWQYVKAYWKDTKAIVASPFHWKGKDFLKFGLITALGVGLYTQDQKIRDWSQLNKSDLTNAVSEVVDPFGNGRYLMLTSGVIFLHGQIFKNKKTTRVGLLILESQLINGVLGQFVKVMAGRERPYTAGVYDIWQGPKIPFGGLSFPSGHAQTSFALMTVIALEFKKTKWVPPLAYTLAGLTCLSRINADAHWASDLFIGAALGYFVSKKIVAQHTNPHNRLTLSPFNRYGSSGMSMCLKF